MLYSGFNNLTKAHLNNTPPPIYNIHMKKMLILFVLALFLFPQGVLADVIQRSIIPSTTKTIYSCFEISNINAYPDYVFRVHNAYSDPKIIESRSYIPKDVDLDIIKDGDCTLLLNGLSYDIHWSTDYITASKKLDNTSKNVSFELFNATKYDLYRSYPEVGSVDIYDPRDARTTVVMEIVSITNDKLELKKSKVIYTYTDGTSEEKIYQNQDVVPEPSRKALFTSWMIWFVLPITAIIIIIAVILLRRRSKSRKGKSKK